MNGVGTEEEWSRSEPRIHHVMDVQDRFLRKNIFCLCGLPMSSIIGTLVSAEIRAFNHVSSVRTWLGKFAVHMRRFRSRHSPFSVLNVS